MTSMRNTLLALAMIGFIGDANADLAEVAVVNTSGTEIVPGYVLQGSRNMKKLGKRSTSSTVVVPKLFLESEVSPQPVIPQLATAELKPKPRFGYGSDWTPGKSYQEAAASTVPPSHPIYFFRAPYSTTEYYPAYHFGYDFGCGTWSPFGNHFSFSFSR